MAIGEHQFAVLPFDQKLNDIGTQRAPTVRDRLTSEEKAQPN